MKKQLLILMILPFIASCGFEPIHGTVFKSDGARQADVQAEFGQIHIDSIANREGQYLRNALIDRFYQDGRPVNPAYILKVSPIDEKIVDLDITIESDSTREQLTLRTEMVLIDKATGKALVKRKLRSSASYNVLPSEFATRVSEQNTRDNALDDLARQIELQTKLYLARKK